MMDSILTSVKKILGIDESYTHFDSDLILHINSVLSALCHMGIGPEDGYSISSADDTWTDFLGTATNINEVKTYIALRVRMIFDPPTSSSAVEAFNNAIKEFEWRAYTKVQDYYSEEEDSDDE